MTRTSIASLGIAALLCAGVVVIETSRPGPVLAADKDANEALKAQGEILKDMRVEAREYSHFLEEAAHVKFQAQHSGPGDGEADARRHNDADFRKREQEQKINEELDERLRAQREKLQPERLKAQQRADEANHKADSPGATNQDALDANAAQVALFQLQNFQKKEADELKKHAEEKKKLLAGNADVPKQKHSYGYVCNNDGCKDHGRVYSFKEDTPHEHKCPTCKNRLDQVKDD